MAGFLQAHSPVTENESIIQTTLPFGIENATLSFKIKLERSMISDEVVAYFLLINFCDPGQCGTILGLIVNVLNIFILVKRVRTDSVNIHLRLGQRVTELEYMIFLFSINLCCTPTVTNLQFYPKLVMYYFGVTLRFLGSPRGPGFDLQLNNTFVMLRF